MLREIDTLARLVAWGQRRAVFVRETSAIAPDPPETFGLSIIRLVGEQRIQSVAFGLLGRFPTTSVSTNPLDRDVGYLEPLAVALNEYVSSMLARGLLPRVWVANEATRQCLALFGTRYRSNPRAGETIRALGRLCTAITDDSEYAGAQILVNAVRLFQDHLRTGQSQLQDSSLGAMLAWASPEPGVEPWVEADRRSLEPSAAVMYREDDDAVEQLRDRVKRAGKKAQALRALADKIQNDREQSENLGRLAARRIERLRERAIAADRSAIDAQNAMTHILSEAAVQEFSIMLEANLVFWSLPLLPCPGIEQLVSASLQRLTSALNHNSGTAREPHSLSMDLDAREHAVALTESIYLAGDNLIREQMRYQGRVVRGIVVDVRQPRSNRRPCNVVMRTHQAVLRIRPGTKLRVRGSAVVGVVAAVTEDQITGGTLIDIELTAGLRAVPSIGIEIDTDDAVLFGASHRARKTYLHMARTRPQLVYGELPAPQPRNMLPAGDLLDTVKRLRRHEIG